MVSNVVKDPTDFHCMNNLLLVLTKTETIIKKSRNNYYAKLYLQKKYCLDNYQKKVKY